MWAGLAWPESILALLGSGPSFTPSTNSFLVHIDIDLKQNASCFVHCLTTAFVLLRVRHITIQSINVFDCDICCVAGQAIWNALYRAVWGLGFVTETGMPPQSHHRDSGTTYFLTLCNLIWWVLNVLEWRVLIGCSRTHTRGILWAYFHLPIFQIFEPPCQAFHCVLFALTMPYVFLF